MSRVAQYILRILIVVFLNLCVIGIVGYMIHQGYQPKTVEVLSKQGSQGNEVQEIQQRLSDWGYYSGQVDGIFGDQTAKAVRRFQQDHGLTADGVAGPKTLEQMGIASSEATSGGAAGMGDSDFHLLARLVSAEARGEPFNGQVAVAAVILNRVEHPSFPDSISGVAYQPGAFTALTDGQINENVADSAYRAAREALNGADPSGGAIYYYNPDRAINQWIRTRPVITQIGKHLFCS
ncbi:spore cortex-lytic enzyme [Oscillospiraceae bacterium MB08-C2-2]|nr:spore cortex-lytic enzyme [Oscillospiraceae bacterium MB08-C2-2]